MEVSKAIEHVGLTKVANACEVSPAAVHRWKTRNRLPRTEWTGETDYAVRIAALHGDIEPNDLLVPPTAQP
jgi:hypothetical protein